MFSSTCTTRMLATILHTIKVLSCYNSMLNAFLIFTKALHFTYVCTLNNLKMYEGEEGISMAFANREINHFKISQKILITITLSTTQQNKNN